MRIQSPASVALARRMLAYYGNYDAMRKAGKLVDGVWLVPLPASAMSASGQDPQGLEAKPASAARSEAEGDAHV